MSLKIEGKEKSHSSLYSVRNGDDDGDVYNNFFFLSETRNKIEIIKSDR